MTQTCPHCPADAAFTWDALEGVVAPEIIDHMETAHPEITAKMKADFLQNSF